MVLPEGLEVVLDFKSYFETIRHERLLELVQQRFVDGSVLALLEQSLKAGVLGALKDWQPTERGTPQGAVISPLLANLYLNPLDHQMARLGWQMVRYANDFVVLCHTQEEAQLALAYLRQGSQEAGLTVHLTRTRRGAALAPEKNAEPVLHAEAKSRSQTGAPKWQERGARGANNPTAARLVRKISLMQRAQKPRLLMVKPRNF